MTTVLFRFLLVYGRTISVLQFFFINFPKNYFDSESWRKKFGWTGEKNIFWRHFHSIIIYLPFSQYNHIQNFEEKKLFQHFANLIKIRSTRLLPILDLIILPVPKGGGGYTVLPLSVRPSKIFFVTFFSATIDGRNLIFGHKLHIGMPYRGKRFWNHQIPTSCLPT